MGTRTVEHADDGPIECYRALHHTVTRAVNDRSPQTAMSVTLNPVDGYPSDWAIDVATVDVIVQQYINGSLGSETTSYWCWKRDRGDWRRATSARDEHAIYEDEPVRLVADDIHTWHPIAESVLSESDERYHK